MKAENYLKRFKVGNPNPDHAIADQVYQGFHKKLPFPVIMAMIKRHGRQFVYEAWNGMKESNPKNPVALFLWKCKQNKINFKQAPLFK